jgi:hypothetical protein
MHVRLHMYVSILQAGMLWRYHGNKEVPQISRDEAQQNFSRGVSTQFKRRNRDHQSGNGEVM